MNNFELAKEFFLAGISNLERGNFSEAEQQFKQSLAHVPDRVSTLTNLSSAQFRLKKFSEAQISAKQAISMQADNCEAYLNLGLIEKEVNNLSASIEYFDIALLHNSDYCEAWSNKGNALHELWRYDEALAHFDKALSINPIYHEAWANKGVTLHELGRHEEAVAHFNKAVSLRPDFNEAYWNKAITLLHLGDYEQGWALFERRWQLPSLKSSQREYAQPRWLGHESLEGKTILVWSEQGLGDTIQFCRYIKNLSDLGAQVIFEVQKELVSSLRNLAGVASIIQQGQKPPLFDFHCPLMSLPLAFKTSLQTIPSKIPYIFPDPLKVSAWKEKVGDQKNLKIGLVWSSGHRPQNPELWGIAERKNIPLISLEKLNHPNIQYFSLQKGAQGERQLQELEEKSWGGPKIINYSNQLNDFSDTVGLIANLDLVISVDTAVAHMAGAMGKPIWVLSQFLVDWRWSDGQKESWYPTAIVFQQPNHGNWDAVADQIKAKLETLI